MDEMILLPHEALELHEVLRGEMTAVTKLQATMGVVRDPDLKAFMRTTLNNKQMAIRQYLGFHKGVGRHN